MIIGIDGNEANQKIRTGSGVYAFELLRQFKKNQKSKIKYQIYLKDKPLNELPQKSLDWKYKIIGPKNWWTQIGLPIELWKEKLLGSAPDVFFSPSHYAPRFCPIPSVTTIFDLSFIRFPEMFLKKDLFQLQNWTEYSVRQAKRIITISEFSKKEIVDYYKISADKVVVAYPGYDKQKFRIQNSESRINGIKIKYKIAGDYIIYVGTVQPRKNLERLLEAFEMLRGVTYENNKDLKLVICGMLHEGRGGWMNTNIKNKISNIKKKVILTGYVTDNDLPYLISGAKALVIPSLYEGFGIPVVEAMACGVPTVVSNVSSLPEITSNASILVDPYNVDSIASGIKEACYNESKREILIKKGLRQAEKFDWGKSSLIILNMLEKVCLK